MSYCPKCGKSLKKIENFCADCGAKIKGLVKDVGKEIEEIAEETEEVVEKTNYKGLVIFIIFLIIVGYVILDLWAMSQLTPVISLGSIFTTISNFDGEISLSQTSVSSTIRMENPTFVPIVFARISYDANYGDTKVAEGKTGFFIIAPYSQKDIPVDLTLYNLNALKSGLKWVWDLIIGNQERKYANIYLDIGITKFRIKTLE